VKVGDVVSPKKGRRTHWVGLLVEQREYVDTDGLGRAGLRDCLIQWVQCPQGPAWWVDWSLEVVSESR